MNHKTPNLSKIQQAQSNSWSYMYDGLDRIQTAQSMKQMLYYIISNTYQVAVSFRRQLLIYIPNTISIKKMQLWGQKKLYSTIVKFIQPQKKAFGH